MKKIFIDNSNITYNNKKILGSNNKIQGDNNKIIGDNNNVYGSQNKVIGDNNSIVGDNNKMVGDNNDAKGQNNKMIGSNNSSSSIKTSINGIIKKNFHLKPIEINSDDDDKSDNESNYTQSINIMSVGNNNMIKSTLINNGIVMRADNITTIGNKIDIYDLVFLSAGPGKITNNKDMTIRVKGVNKELIIRNCVIDFNEKLYPIGSDSLKIENKKVFFNDKVIIDLCIFDDIKDFNDEKTDKDNEQCTICFDNKKHIVLNCGHVFCKKCILGLLEKRCPNCKVDISSVKKIFI